MSDSENDGKAYNDMDQLNYSPDTKYLLSMDAREKNRHMIHAGNEGMMQMDMSRISMIDTHKYGPQDNILSFNNSMYNQQMIPQSNVGYILEPQQYNLVQMNDGMMNVPNYYVNQPINQIPMQTVIDPTNSRDAYSYGIPMLPNNNSSGVTTGAYQNTGTNNNPAVPELVFPGQTNVASLLSSLNYAGSGRTNEISTNIYVSKGATKVSEAEDWSPNPLKLIEIMAELEKLNEVINKLKDDDTTNLKPSAKRERNRLASKACRLKKKATHETNKIKLEGLELEFKLLILSLHYMSWEIINHVTFKKTSENLLARIKEIYNQYSGLIKVAGDSDSFVKSVLDRYKHEVASSSSGNSRHKGNRGVGM